MWKPTLALLTLAGSLLGACRSQSSTEPAGANGPRAVAEEPSQPPASRPASSAPGRPGRPELPIARGSEERAPGDKLRPGQSDSGRIATRPTGGFGDRGKVLLAPGPGTSRTRIDGCLSVASANEEAAARFPARPVVRSAPQKQVTIRLGAGGITAVHELDHACCLKARVDTSVSGGVVQIVEKLSGMPCRCRCHSTINTVVGLSPGNHEVVVILEQRDGTRKEVHRERVSVGIRRK